MYTINEIVRQRQPRGGFLPNTKFTQIYLGGEKIPQDNENLKAWSVAKTVKYLTMAMRNGGSIENAFEIPMMGVETVGSTLGEYLMSKITDLDDKAVKSACKLSAFDTFAFSRRGDGMPEDWSVPDETTIEQIRDMTERAVRFFDDKCHIVMDNLKFPGAYTPITSDGVGDMVSDRTLWLMTTTVRKRPLPRNTLTVLLQYIMSRHTDGPLGKAYGKIENLGIYNPRLDIASVMRTEELDQEMMKEVGDRYLGYGLSRQEMTERLCRMQGLEAGDSFAIGETIRYIKAFTQPYEYDECGGITRNEYQELTVRYDQAI